MGLFGKKKNEKAKEYSFTIREYGSQRTYLFVAPDERGALEMMRYTLDLARKDDNAVIDCHSGIWELQHNGKSYICVDKK